MGEDLLTEANWARSGDLPFVILALEAWLVPIWQEEPARVIPPWGGEPV